MARDYNNRFQIINKHSHFASAKCASNFGTSVNLYYYHLKETTPVIKEELFAVLCNFISPKLWQLFLRNLPASRISPRRLFLRLPLALSRSLLQNSVETFNGNASQVRLSSSFVVNFRRTRIKADCTTEKHQMRFVVLVIFIALRPLSFSLSLSQTHTHTHSVSFSLALFLGKGACMRAHRGPAPTCARVCVYVTIGTSRFGRNFGRSPNRGRSRVHVIVLSKAALIVLMLVGLPGSRPRYNPRQAMYRGESIMSRDNDERRRACILVPSTCTEFPTPRTPSSVHRQARKRLRDLPSFLNSATFTNSVHIRFQSFGSFGSSICSTKFEKSQTAKAFWG